MEGKSSELKMAREKDCCNKTRDTMELEVQMTSRTLNFSSN